MRQVTLVALLALAPLKAQADVDVGLLGGWGQAGPQASAEIAYSPQGFWALGLRGTADPQGSFEPAFLLRGGLDIFQWVPRLELSFGYAETPTWGLSVGMDYFLMRALALRTQGGYSSFAGWLARGGLAWFPFE